MRVILHSLIRVMWDISIQLISVIFRKRKKEKTKGKSQVKDKKEESLNSQEAVSNKMKFLLSEVASSSPYPSSTI